MQLVDFLSGFRNYATTPGKVKDLSVSVDITHTYKEDLVVVLFAPSGQRVNLHNKSGGSADNILETYSPATTPGLNTFLQQPIQGDWRLHISDHAGADKGKLNRWQLKIAKDL